jgi:hypothetical protein
MSNFFGFMIEGLVAILLVLTICYCALLNKRLKSLKADEHSMKAMISELFTATEIAERAITGLKVTIRECDENLGRQIEDAEKLAQQLTRQVDAGERVLSRITKIAAAGSASPAQGTKAEASTEGPKAVLAAAQAFAERSRQRVNGVAA